MMLIAIMIKTVMKIKIQTEYEKKFVKKKKRSTKKKKFFFLFFFF